MQINTRHGRSDCLIIDFILCFCLVAILIDIPELNPEFRVNEDESVYNPAKLLCKFDVGRMITRAEMQVPIRMPVNLRYCQLTI